MPLADAETFGHTWAAKASCDAASDPAACMRALDGNAVTLVMPQPASVASDARGGYQPDVDGVALTGSSDAVISARARHNHVPFVIGSNSDETSLELAKAYPSGMTTAQYQAAVLAYASGNQTLANSIVAQYQPYAELRDALEAYIQMTTDAKFTSERATPARVAVMGQPGPARAWRYFYAHHLDTTGPPSRRRSAHGTRRSSGSSSATSASAAYTPSAGEQGLADAIDDVWTAVAASGAPSGGSVTWTRYAASSDPYVQIRTTNVHDGDGAPDDAV